MEALKDKKSNDKSATKLDEKLAAYWDLVDRQESLQRRVRKATEEKNSVSERIFEKVTDEYNREIDRLAEQLVPMKQELEVLKQERQTELDHLNHEIAEIEDDIAEAEFRGRVGEYTDDDLGNAIGRYNPRLEDKETAKSQLLREIASFDARRAADRSFDRSATSPDTSSASTSSSPKSSSPSASRDKLDFDSDSADSSTSARPSIQAEEATEKTTSKSTVTMDVVDDDDPLAALADPSSKKSESKEPTGFPNLVIQSGPHEGKVIPLLPMTMSLGREHDNNIELKDPDVARYHARITYQSGKFSIDDLDSMSGTFVNGKRVEQKVLGEGDVIKVGATELTVSY